WFYRNGVLEGAAFASYPQLVASWSGDGPASIGQGFVGAIDEIALYPTVLTQDQISNHYALRTATSAVTLPLSATDPDHDVLTYGATGLPPGLELNPMTGVITGDPEVAGTYTVTATAKDPTALTSAQTFTWTITPNAGTLPAPTISPASGIYTSGVDVTISSIAGGTIRYTLDGTDPALDSPVYTSPLSVTTSSTLKVKGWAPNYLVSPVASADYTIAMAQPTISPASGAYPAGRTITISTASPGASIKYTLTGVDPVATDSTIPSGGTIVAGNYVLKASAWKDGATPSSVTTATYSVTGQYAAPAIVTGSSTSLAVRPDGTVWGWGRNMSGSADDGTTLQRLNPMAGGLTGVRAIAGGGSTSFAIMPDGTVQAWGDNGQGQLGDGATEFERHLPAQVSGLTNVVGIDTGSSHAVALKSDGTLLTWGANFFGQLGDGTTTQRSVPVTMSALTGITAVSAGGNHTLALKSDGTVWAWGRNFNGQLGDGTTTQRLTPVQVSGLSNVIAIQAGDLSSLAIKSDGTLWVWGFNFYGQLADGTTTNHKTAEQVVGVTGVVSAGFGSGSLVALLSDNTVWTAGTDPGGR
ncbi:MAG TPA: chitobiase/beta-hexosaminidase C-terminal domain-containing protein, partial [Vicinamibacterales bacterium]